jgi:hypothetical protein
MAEESPKSVAESAAAAISPDPLTAELLAKRSAGEKLSPSEYGKLGAFASKVKTIFAGKADRNAQSNQPGAVNGNTAGLAASPPAQAPDNGLPVVHADPRLVQRTTAAVLTSADTIAQRYVSREARKAGADDKTVNRFVAAAALPAPTKDLMVETSPEVLAALGVDPRHYPIAVFLGGLGLWGTNLWLCVDELKALQKAKPKEEPKKIP